MSNKWRHIATRAGLFVAATMVVGAMATVSAMAQNFPVRPIKLIHGFAPGGAADTLARIVSDGLSKKLGQPVVVESKPGAGGNIAAVTVAQAAPDGYTLNLVTGAHAISSVMYENPPFKPTDDFEMISTLVSYALVIAVRADHPAKSLGDLIAMAKQKPASVSFGSVGFGSTHHLAGELLNVAAGIEMLHIPYRGDSQSITALLAGDVPVVVGTTVLLASQIQGGTVRGLAVTSSARTALLPQVPAADEAGVKGYDVRTWAGIVAPKGVPPHIVARLNAEVAAVIAEPATKQALEKAIGGEVRGSTPDQMRALIDGEVTRWAGVVKAAKLPLIK